MRLFHWDNRRRVHIVLAIVLVSIVVGAVVGWTGSAIAAGGAESNLPPLKSLVVQCGTGDFKCVIQAFFANLILSIVDLLQMVLLMLLELLLMIGKYNGFLQSPVVTVGWVIIRDLANLFFILILLAIAFSTIVGSEKLHYKQHLVKLLLMAIVINFSKMITGIFIDFSQVLLMTFGNAIGGYGSLSEGIGFIDQSQINPDSDGGTAFFGLLLSLIFNSIFIVFAIIVIGLMFVLFLARILALWILTMTSPIAFFLSAFPQGQQYAGKWWSQLSGNLISGPVLMFFLWLTLKIQKDVTKAIAGVDSVTTSVAATKFGTADVLVSFAITMGLLIAGIKMAVEAGGAGASVVGKASDLAQSFGKGTLKFGAKRLDDTQAWGQKRILESKMGGALLKGGVGGLSSWLNKQDRKGLGGVLGRAAGRFVPSKHSFEQIQEHGGVKLRTIPSAWTKGQERYETQAAGRSEGLAQDLINSGRLWGPEHTRKADEEFEALAQHAKGEQEKLNGEKQFVLSEIIKQDTHEVIDKETGEKYRQAIPGRETQLAGKLEILMSQHDPNEILKHPLLNQGMDVTPEAMVEAYKKLFGDNAQARRLMARHSEIAYANTDAWMKGLAVTNPDTGEAYFYNDEEYVKQNEVNKRLSKREKEKGRKFEGDELKREKLTVEHEVEVMSKEDLGKLAGASQRAEVIAFIKKRTGREQTSKLRAQDHGDELADDFGDRFFQFNERGWQDLLNNGQPQTQQWQYANPETRTAHGKDMLRDIIERFMKEKDTMTLDKKKVMSDFIKEVARAEGFSMEGNPMQSRFKFDDDFNIADESLDWATEHSEERLKEIDGMKSRRAILHGEKYAPQHTDLSKYKGKSKIKEEGKKETEAASGDKSKGKSTAGAPYASGGGTPALPPEAVKALTAAIERLGTSIKGADLSSKLNSVFNKFGSHFENFNWQNKAERRKMASALKRYMEAEESKEARRKEKRKSVSTPKKKDNNKGAGT